MKRPTKAILTRHSRKWVSSRLGRQSNSRGVREYRTSQRCRTRKHHKTPSRNVASTVGIGRAAIDRSSSRRDQSCSAYAVPVPPTDRPARCSRSTNIAVRKHSCSKPDPQSRMLVGCNCPRCCESPLLGKFHSSDHSCNALAARMTTERSAVLPRASCVAGTKQDLPL